MVRAGEVIRASDVAVQACRVTRSAVQSIPDNAVTTVAFDAEEFDTDGMHSTVTSNSRITINTAGFYIVGFNGLLAGAADYTRTFAILIANGSTEIARSSFGNLPISTTPQLDVTTVDQFDAGDYIEVQVYQDNTVNAARNLEQTAARSPEFYAARIGS